MTLMLTDEVLLLLKIHIIIAHVSIIIIMILLGVVGLLLYKYKHRVADVWRDGAATCNGYRTQCEQGVELRQMDPVSLESIC